MIRESPANLPAVIDVDYAAQILACEASTVEELCRQGKLPAKKWGTSWMLPTGAFLHVVNNVALIEAAERAEGKKPAPTLVSLPGGRKEPPQLPEI